MDSHQDVELDIGDAWQWIVHAGEAIYDLFEAGPESEPATEGMAVKGSGWRGTLGFKLERWAFWRDRFECIGNELVETREGKAAANAARVMRTIESAIVENISSHICCCWVRSIRNPVSSIAVLCLLSLFDEPGPLRKRRD